MSTLQTEACLSMLYKIRLEAIGSCLSGILGAKRTVCNSLNSGCMKVIWAQERTMHTKETLESLSWSLK